MSDDGKQFIPWDISNNDVAVHCWFAVERLRVVLKKTVLEQQAKPWKPW